MIGFGSYIVHVAQIEGSIFVVLAIGDIFIIAGIILVILVVVGIIGAALSSKIVLCQVTSQPLSLTSNSIEVIGYCIFEPLMQYIFFVVAVILLLVVGGILGFVYREKIVRFI